MLNWLSNGQLEPFQAEDNSFGAYKIFHESSPRPVLMAEDIMSTQVITVGPQCSVVKAISLMNERAIHHLPVVEAQRLVGMVSDRDLFGHETKNDSLVRDLMSTRLLTARKDSSLWKIAQIMTTGRVHCVLVIDEEQALQGLLTSLDILACMTYQAPTEVWL